MKRILWLIASLAISATVWGQTSTRTTRYETFQPARVTLASGNVVMQKQANIFLKDASLAFKNGRHTMIANMAQVREVEFADVRFVSIDSMLAAVVDTVGKNKVLCTTVIDMEAYRKGMINDRVISNLSLSGEIVGMSSISVTDESDREYPLKNTYYFEVGGKVIKAHERVVNRHLPREKRERLKFYMDMPDFQWTDPQSLKLVLMLFEE